MNKSHYVGKRISSIELYDEVGPVTGVALVVDEEHEFFAGDETGYVLEMECPYATQDMADAVLAQVTGHTYKGFRAEGAVLALDAELGDGVTVNGVYSMLAHRKVDFGPGHLSEIAAPGEHEVDHEYPYLSPLQKELRRSKATLYSLIEKTTSEIRLEVGELDGKYTELKVTIDGVTVTDDSGTTLIKGSSIETGSITADKLVLTGAITFNDLDSSTQSMINNAGLSEADARTIITSTLVSSPTIAGGKFMNLGQTTWIEVGKDADGVDNDAYGLAVFNSKYGNDAIFSIWNGDFGVTTLSGKVGFSFLIIDAATSSALPRGTWDFSGASTSGLYLRFS